MFDARDLLNSLLGGGQAAPGGQVPGQAPGQGGGSLSDMLGQVQNQMRGTQAGDMLGKVGGYASANPGATAALGAGLAALLFGGSGGRQAAGGMIKAGGAALLGTLAYTAFQNFQSGKPLLTGIPGLEQLTPPAAGSPFHQDSHTDTSARTILRAMVAAASADGHVDADEKARIMQSAGASGLDADATAFLNQEMANPASVQEIATAVGNSPELAAQVYLGARLATATPSPDEVSFLASLAKSLPLPPALIPQLDAAAKPA